MLRIQGLFFLLVVAAVCAVAQVKPDAQGAAPSSQKPVADGPFGFKFGMTKADVIRLIGKAKVKEEDGDILTLATAPRPHPDFESYVVWFSPTEGLLKISAVSQDIETSGDGTQLRARFSSVRDALANTYGKPKEEFDFVKAGSLFTEPQYFMMSMQRKDRSLLSYWIPVGNASRITAIEVYAEALSSIKGYVVINYEFEGWDAYQEQQKKKKDSVF